MILKILLKYYTYEYQSDNLETLSFLQQVLINITVDAALKNNY